MGNIRFAYTNHLEHPDAVLLNGPSVTVAANSCVSGVAQVTRASGSYAADGVKVKALLTGTIAARFPASTRVNAVGTTSCTMSAAASSSTPSPESGNFVPNQPLTESADAPTANLMNKQRYVPWDTGASPPDPMFLEFDLGGSKAMTLLGMLGHKPADAAAGGIYQIDLFTATVYPTFTFRASIVAVTFLERDLLTILSNVSARYLSLQVYAGLRFTLGALWIGVVNQDLGFQFAPGTTMRRIRPVTRFRTAAGVPYYIRNGDERREWELQYPTIQTATRQKIESAFANTENRPPLLIDDDDVPYEVEFTDGGLAWARRFVGLDSMSVILESLP